MNKFFLTQIIDIPTRKDKILDVILVNNKNIFTHNEVIINSLYSDHNTIISYMNMKSDTSNGSKSCYHLYDTEIPSLKTNIINFTNS